MKLSRTTVQENFNLANTGTAADVFALAEEYRNAADVLLQLGGCRKPFGRAPYRLVAIHAIELYLNALLLIDGIEPSQIRALRHDLAARARHASASGLVLRDRTTAHLTALAESKEYLVSRYGTDRENQLSQMNRLQATLDEVRSKVENRLTRSVDRPKAKHDASTKPGPTSKSMDKDRRDPGL